MDNYIKYKYFNKKLIKLFFIIIVMTGLFNYVINPYNIFDTSYLPFKLYSINFKLDSRISKFLAFKLNKSDVNTVFIGTSRVADALNPQYFEQKSSTPPI